MRAILAKLGKFSFGATVVAVVAIGAYHIFTHEKQSPGAAQLIEMAERIETLESQNADMVAILGDVKTFTEKVDSLTLEVAGWAEVAQASERRIAEETETLQLVQSDLITFEGDLEQFLGRLDRLSKQQAHVHGVAHAVEERLNNHLRP